MFNYCPSCGKAELQFDGRNKFLCARCGFVYFHNTAAACGIILRGRNGILLLERAVEPQKGMLDLPGGFVDPGEGVLDALKRECMEELQWGCPSEARFLASFPNVYNYKNVDYNTCDIFFTIDAPFLTEKDIKLEEKEVAACRFCPAERINLEEIAFPSAKAALKLYIEQCRNMSAPS